MKPDGQREIGVGVVGAGWLGDVHARAWSRLRHHYPDLAVAPRLVAVADTVPAARESALRKHGFASGYADWHDLIADERIDVVSITAPNAMHRQIGVAAARATKHIWIEKPVGLGAADAQAIADAAGGVQATVGFNYRAVPAMTRLRDLVADGAVGTPTHARVRMLSDYAAHPLGLLSWRYTIESAGHGVFGDLASHAVDLVRFTLGEVAGVVARSAIVIDRRPVPVPAAVSYGHGLGRPGDATGRVENEDVVTALLHMRSGAVVTLECSRVATGEQNNYGIEVHGTRGLVSWDFRTPGELLLSRGEGYVDQPAQRLLVGPGAGDYARFQPGAGITMSFDDTKVIELAGLVRSILSGDHEGPGLADAVAASTVLEAMVRSASGGGWVDL